MDYAIPLAKHSKDPLFSQVYAGLRKGILTGKLRRGDRLPSTRQLAEQLGVSRTVVLLAYDQLLAEGFTRGTQGSGTFVSDAMVRAGRPKPKSTANVRLSKFGAAAASSVLDMPAEKVKRLRYDFAFGRNSMATFPFEAWRRILLRHSRATSVRGLDYGPPTGAPELRDAICSHVRRARGIVCDPSEIMILNGSQQALDLISRILIDRGDKVAIEDPHYQGAREVLRAAGARLYGVPVDCEGLDPGRLPRQAKALFVTPSHQFPTGVVLSLSRRMAVLGWASRTNAIIVENDYDGEFHYEGYPVESMHSLDSEGRIVYIGTFSRTVFPSLHIGYVIVPKGLSQAFRSAKWLSDQHSATLEQQTLAEFISSGLYGRHLRKLRRANALRRDALVQSVAKHCGDRVAMTGEESGAHVVLWPQSGQTESALIRQAADKGVGIYGISHCFLGEERRAGMMLGYARLSEREIREGIRLLSETF